MRAKILISMKNPTFTVGALALFSVLSIGDQVMGNQSSGKPQASRTAPAKIPPIAHKKGCVTKRRGLLGGLSLMNAKFLFR